jgi:predicted ATPase
LALELARRQIGRRGDGVWLVDLTAAPGPENVAGETARVFGVRPPSGATPSDALRRFLADRDALLVLDNCEQCRSLRILATSADPVAELRSALASVLADDGVPSGARRNHEEYGAGTLTRAPAAA